MASKTHKDRVSEFNNKLEALSEHHDIPKVRPARSSHRHTSHSPSGWTWITQRTLPCLRVLWVLLYTQIYTVSLPYIVVGCFPPNPRCSCDISFVSDQSNEIVRARKNVNWPDVCLPDIWSTVTEQVLVGALAVTSLASPFHATRSGCIMKAAPPAETAVDKKGHVCPPSDATHPRDRWETLFVYAFICKFTQMKTKVEGLDSPMECVCWICVPKV